jgi:hypothetical protein
VGKGSWQLAENKEQRAANEERLDTGGGRKG